ncbi:MAG: hypothetical protein KDD64_13840 [Bdellovibrionales bacterium]|nr:hypothetical protein [Bdellovibrionales bacterium]
MWSFEASPDLRSVALKGASPVQAALTQLPSEWQSGSTYVVQSDSEVTFEELRRGEQSPPRNSISLSRELWTDLDGSGFTVQDVFSGTMNQNFRLNVLSETQLGRATADGSPALVTKDPNTDLLGVELRSQSVNVTGVSRLASEKTFSAVGWDTPVESLTYNLHLPPSWQFFHVSGADANYQTWVDSWSLLDIFIALLIALGSFKLFGIRFAGLVGVFLLLSHNEFVAPRIFLIYVLVFFVWQRLAENRGRGWEISSKLCLGLTFAALTLQALAFAKLQFIQMLFPQLQSGTRYTTFIQTILNAIESSLLIWPFILLLLVVIFFGIRALRAATGFWNFIGRLFLFGVLFIVVCVVVGPFSFSAGYLNMAPAPQYYAGQNKAYYEDQAYELASRMPSSVGRKFSQVAEPLKEEAFSFESKNLLSGPALPSWKWRTYSFVVPGPVGPEYQLSLCLFPPWLTRILSGIRVLTALLLIGLLVQLLGYLELLRPLGVEAKKVIPFVLLTAALSATHAKAEFPSENLLRELESRMNQERCTDLPCATIGEMELSIREDSFRLVFTASSEGMSSIVLPGPLEVLVPSEVIRNGKATTSFRRVKDGFLEIQTVSGENRFEITGALPLASSFSLQFQSRPLWLQVKTEDWFVEGLPRSGVVRESLRFTRKSSSEDAPSGAATSGSQKDVSTDLQSWFVVKRTVYISQEIISYLQIDRIGTLGKAVEVRVPLLPEERITSGAATIENSSLLVRFPAGKDSLHFRGELSYKGNLTLSAMGEPHMSEQWIISCSAIMNCSTSGLRPTHSVFGGKKSSIWNPFPGESVTVEYRDLEGLKGDFLTIDSLAHDISWGAQILKGTLELSVRATEQTPFSITAPETSTISDLQVGGVSGSGTIDERKGVVLLGPGEHKVSLSYTVPWQAGTFERTPEVTLSAPVHNLEVQVHPSSDRWILWTGGISWGPCVLFWGKLIFVVALCVGLSFVSLIPASLISAALLGVGLTSIPLVWMTIPLVWLATLKLIPLFREQWLRVPKFLRLILFVGLSLFALVWFFKIVQLGLVLEPPMLIVGNQSDSSTLKWFVDHASSTIPQPWVLSLPMWCWRAFVLAWSAWLVLALFSWLRLAVDIERENA